MRAVPNTVTLVLLILLMVLFSLLPGDARSEEGSGFGSHQEDVIYYQPLGSPNQSGSVRVGITVEPYWVNPKFKVGDSEVRFGDTLVLFPSEVMGAVAMGSGEVQLTRARATLLRFLFSRLKPLDIGTYYKDLDRGITDGLDVIGFRIPIYGTDDGSIIVRGGIDMGVVHYERPISDKWFGHASGVVDAKASTQFLASWIRTGIMAKLHYDADLSHMAGPGAGSMGYLSFLLNRDHKLTARIYAGGDYLPARENVGLPATSAYTGVSFFGTFENGVKLQ